MKLIKIFTFLVLSFVLSFNTYATDIDTNKQVDDLSKYINDSRIISHEDFEAFKKKEEKKDLKNLLRAVFVGYYLGNKF